MLFAGLGSNWPLAVTVAVLVCAAGLATVATTASVCGVPGATVPTFHSPLLDV